MRSAHLDNRVALDSLESVERGQKCQFDMQQINEMRLSLIGKTGNRYDRRRGGRYDSQSATMHVREMADLISGMRQEGRQALASLPYNCMNELCMRRVVLRVQY